MYMHAPRSDLALEYFLQWLECTMLACELVSIGFFDIVINDVEHVHVCVDHRVRGDAFPS